MPSIVLRILVSGALALTASHASAESDPRFNEEQRATLNEVKEIDDAKADTPSTALTSKIVIEGSEDKGIATLRIGNYFGPSTASVYRWSLTASAPFTGEKEKERQIGDLSGLTAGSTATLDLGWVGIDSIKKRAERVDEKSIGGACQNRNAKIPLVTCERIQQACEPYVQAVFGGPLNKIKEIAKLQRDQNCTESLFDEVLFDKSPTVLQLRDRARLDPQARAELEGLTALREEYRKRYRKILGPPGPIWSAGTRLKASRTNFKYFLGSDVATEFKDSRTSGSVGAYINRIYHGQLIGLSYNRTSNYEPGRKTQICIPIGTMGLLECSEKIRGAPTKSTPDIVSAEWRYLITPRSIAVSPIVEYDLDEDEWAARFPIYAAINKDGDLVGGLSINWDSKEDEVQAVVFFGKKFTLID